MVLKIPSIHLVTCIQPTSREFRIILTCYHLAHHYKYRGYRLLYSCFLSLLNVCLSFLQILDIFKDVIFFLICLCRFKIYEKPLL